MDFRNKICNFCLVKCENYKCIEGNMKSALDILLPTIEFSVIREPVMCNSCEEMLWKCFAFKEKCISSYDNSVSLINNKGVDKPDVKRKKSLRKNTTGAGVAEDQEVCDFCMNLVKSYAGSFDVDKGRIILEKMIERCLPELDSSAIKNPIICADCHRSLENCFRFVTNYLAVDEKIKKYFASLDIDSKGEIDLNSLFCSIMGTVKASDIDGNIDDMIEAEKQSSLKIENAEEIEIGAIKLEQMSYDDNEYVNVIVNKNENMSNCSEEDNIPGAVKREETFYAENETKPNYGNFVEMDDQKCILNEEIEVKSEDHDFTRFEKSIIRTQTKVNTSFNSRQKFLTSKLDELKKPHDDTTITSYQCERGLFHRKEIICHKASSKVKMFKCDSCPFQAKKKDYLKSHMWMHIDPSEVTIFKCDSCPFQARDKDNLKKHMLKHMDPSKGTLFKCDSCPYQARNKCILKKHMLKHMDPSDITMFKCDSCSFQTKRRSTLKNHALKHMDSSEVTMFTCDSCPYQTRWKDKLKSHALKHMDPSEVTMFKCDSCPFQTRRKYNLKNHALKHMDSSEVTMFTCNSCPYQTRLKSVFKNHMLTHMDPSELKMFICDICSYRTKYKYQLKRHSVTHKKSSNVKS